MSRRANVLGGVGVEVSPTSNSTINNTITIRNVNSQSSLSEAEPTTDPVEVKYPRDNPYESNLSPAAEDRIEDVKELVATSERTCEALSMMVDIIYSNPLIINKLVVTDATSLSELIKLLTNSDKVEVFIEDPECTCLKNSFLKVSKIHVTKYSIANEFKYSYPKAKHILDEHHISIKYVRII